MVTHRILAAIALVSLAAAPIAAPGQTASKAAPKAAAAKAAPKAAAPKTSGRFDPRDPASLITLLGAMDAKASVNRKTDQEVLLDVVTPGGRFGARFDGCDANGKTCKALSFITGADKPTTTLAQINSFN